ncbi:MAG: three-Cys-motif partner protein TcmP [Anaerolineales bacterium]|nr:MAG: three-Cys-motif partner protein TcmP [Anaerolineales bacterium]
MTKSYDNFIGEHSLAKVRLYGYYLAIYLNILSRAGIASKILLFDLFAGEGKYKNEEKGSPIIALECIERHSKENGTCPDIRIVFNDSGMSEIEPEKSKIQRVAEFAAQIPVPNNVEIVYSTQDFKDALKQAQIAFRAERRPAGLFFIDPFGYKEVPPDVIKDILAFGRTEVLLFAPISQMHRFATSAMHDDFPGSEPLKRFLTSLYGDTLPSFKSPEDFIEGIKQQFKNFLGAKFYVGSFSLDAGSNTYALFFFTQSIDGFERMIEAIWKFDPNSGQGFRGEEHPMLLTKYELENYPSKLLQFIQISKSGRTNHELLVFGLENGFRRTHTNQALNQLDDKIEKQALDNKVIRGNYIGNKSRRIMFKVKD